MTKIALITIAAAGAALFGAAAANAQQGLASGFRGDAGTADWAYYYGLPSYGAPGGSVYAPGPRAEYAPSCGLVTIRERIGDRIVTRRVERC